MTTDARAILVIGYGSDLRGDDAAGRHVAAEIERRSLTGVTVISATQLVPEMAEPIAAADLAVFVDASVDTDRVAVRQVEPRSAPDRSHHTTPDALVSLARGLGRTCPPAFVVAVPAVRFGIGDKLSTETGQALPCAIDAVLALIEMHSPSEPRRAAAIAPIEDPTTSPASAPIGGAADPGTPRPSPGRRTAGTDEVSRPGARR